MKKAYSLVIYNSIYGAMGSLIGQFIAMISSVIMGRIVGAEGLGEYTFSMTFSGILYIFMNLGIGGIFQRDISMKPIDAGKYYASALFIRLFFSLPAAIIITLITSAVAVQSASTPMMLLTCTYTGLAGVFLLNTQGLMAVERFDTVFIFNMIQKIFMLAATFIVLYVTGDIILMLIVQNLIFIVLIGGELAFINKALCAIRIMLDGCIAKKLIIESAPTMLGSAADYISLKSDLLILTLLVGNTATALYSVSSNIYIGAGLIPISIAKAFAPRYNRMIIKGEDPKAEIRRIIRWMLVTAVALIAGVILIGRQVIVLLWGEDFSAAYISLSIISISLVFMPLNRLYEYLLIGMNEQRYIARYTAIGAAFNVVSNAILVKLIGINAVAITTVLTEMMVLVMEYRKYTQITAERVSIK